MAVNFTKPTVSKLPEVAIGIDPSTKTGIVAICLKTGEVLGAANLHQAGARTRNKERQKRNPYCRLNAFKLSLEEFMARFKVKQALIETYAFNLHGKLKQSADSMVTQARYGECIRHVLWEHDIDVVEVAPTQLKKFVLGIGKGGKDEIRLGVYKKWGFEFKTDDECDAAVLAMIGYSLLSSNAKVNKVEMGVIDKILSSDRNTLKGVDFT